jgi:SNF2 family DNA or RNA helicase
MRILWDVIVADEAHKIKDKDAKRTVALKKLDHKMGLRKIAMSGTPMEKSPADLWSVLNWLEPKKFHAYWPFVDKYVATLPGFVGRKMVGTKPEALQELASELRPRMIRRSKAEAMPDMPPLIETVVPLYLEPNQRKAYLLVKEAKDLVIKFSDVSDISEVIVAHELTRIIRMQQIASDPAELAVRGEGVKQLWVKEYVRDNPDEQLLVFSRFRNVAVRFAMELNAACIVGGKAPYKLDEFLEGKVRVLCGTIGAMGTALDMPMARTSIFVDTEWSSISMTQATQRMHRAGITEAKHLIYLEAVGTVDKLIRYAVKYKWTDAELVYKFLNSPFEQPSETMLTQEDYPVAQFLAH